MAEPAPAHMIPSGHCRGCGAALPVGGAGGVRCPSCRLHWLPEDLDDPQCGACGYPMRDLGRLVGQTPCPECGKPWPMSIPQPAVRWPGRGVLVFVVALAPLLAIGAAAAFIVLNRKGKEPAERYVAGAVLAIGGLLAGLSLAWAAAQLVGVRSTLARYRARSVERLSQNLMLVALGVFVVGVGAVVAGLMFS